MPPEIYKNGEKKDSFMHFLAYKSPKTPFFVLKYLTKYNHETFFEEYMNLKKSLLKPLQSYTSSKFRRSYKPPAIRIRVKVLSAKCNSFFDYMGPLLCTKKSLPGPTRAYIFSEN
jgi:hypothetical protein